MRINSRHTSEKVDARRNTSFVSCLAIYSLGPAHNQNAEVDEMYVSFSFSTHRPSLGRRRRRERQQNENENEMSLRELLNNLSAINLSNQFVLQREDFLYCQLGRKT